ncbi:pentatricopeptide repeat-containing protein 2, mitochondrial-like [Ptychodera flava]|uniref:pentatricopeptide repeat-containing protein 2, mitochondrial-like n=1 Tax=Ptychodera flava TaxID=63121 RepID=UPI00396A1032
MAAYVIPASRLLLRSLKIGTPRSVYNPNITGVRHLLAPHVTRYDDFEKERMRTEDRLFGDIETLRNAVSSKADKGDVIFTEEVKMILHICYNEQHANLAEKILKSYHKQQRNVSLDKFRFGPVVMRMLNSIKVHNKIIELIKCKELHGFFFDPTSYNLAMDILFEVGDYNGVLDIYDEMEFQGVKKIADSYSVPLAACYKLNTPEAYEVALAILEEHKIKQVMLSRNAYCLVAALAINQNDPIKALSVLSLIRRTDNKICQSIQVIALSMLKRFPEAFDHLQQTYERDVPTFVRKSQICEECLDRVREDTKNDAELSAHFEAIYRNLETGGHISTDALSSLLCLTPVASRTRSMDRRSYAGRSFQTMSRLLIDE